MQSYSASFELGNNNYMFTDGYDLLSKNMQTSHVTTTWKNDWAAVTWLSGSHMTACQKVTWPYNKLLIFYQRPCTTFKNGEISISVYVNQATVNFQNYKQLYQYHKLFLNIYSPPWKLHWNKKLHPIIYLQKLFGSVPISTQTTTQW